VCIVDVVVYLLEQFVRSSFIAVMLPRLPLRPIHSFFSSRCHHPVNVPKRGLNDFVRGNTHLNRFWTWTTQPRPDWKKSPKEAAVLFVVFGITGSSSVALVRPALKHTIGLDGTWKDGPNSYRILSFILVSPIYAVVLLTVVSVL
jgi:hypothetical protein